MKYWILILLVVSLQFARAQPVRLADESGYIMATVDRAERQPTSRKDADVHWIKAQRVHVTQGGAGGALLHGPFTAYHPNGQLRTQGEFKHGLKHGEWRSWDLDGRLVEVQRWRSGVRVGKRIRHVPDREEVLRERNERKVTRRERKATKLLKNKEQRELMDRNKAERGSGDERSVGPDAKGSKKRARTKKVKVAKTKK